MPVPPSIAVVVCSHAPRPDYLDKTLSGLRAQTLPLSDWELVIVDNASPEPISARVDLSWHPSARCVVESVLGLTSARIRGIRETTAPVLVFVDDDNVLSPDYLATALDLGLAHPFLGAWGGAIKGIYEVPPPNFCLQNAHMLAIRDVPRDLWGNTTEDFHAVPCGAGMCIRRSVATLWVDDVKSRPAALKLGRSGSDLGACEDGHLALLSGRLGLGTGVFQRLSLDHLIPKERLTLDYFVRLAAGHAYSYNLLRWILGQPLLSAPNSRSERMITAYRLWRGSRENRAIQMAMIRARARSLAELAGAKR
ncbi:MAG: glycosyltransferase family 2 protein [Opitutaceae bacterium]|nr:glycosyltransferase family 2 protein [Opitutaceae bacterium]